MRTLLLGAIALALTSCIAETSSPAIADHFEVVQGAAQTGTPGWPLDSIVIVRLVDTEGRPMNDVEVRWLVSSGGGRLDSIRTVTGQDGIVSAQWTLGPTSTDQRIRILAADAEGTEVTATVAAFRASTIAVGNRAACALDPNGLLWCWGTGRWAWDGTSGSPIFSPRPIKLAITQAFVSLVGGNDHWCALTAAGRAWCWSGTYQQSTGRDPALGPTWIPGPVQGAPDFATLASGQDHTCGVDFGGQAWCWGQTEDDRGLGGFPNPFRWSLVRVPQPAGVLFTRTASGWAHNCGIATDGGVWCWGYDNWGDLGDTLTGSRNTPTRVPLPGPAREVAAGDYHSCAMLISGPMYCWGMNIANRDFRGSSAELARPRLTDPVASGGLMGGWGMTLAIRQGQVVQTGSLVSNSGFPIFAGGDLRTEPHPIPLGVGGFVQVSGQTSYACGRLVSGEVFCWGEVPGIGMTSTAVAVPAPTPAP